MKKQIIKAFTLVELIVVITILAILGTIAFISFQGYSKSARDSRRINDISNIKTSLELFQVNTSKYPEPTNGYEITYTGSEVWTQGIFGESTFTNVGKLNKIPKDPLVEIEYAYSVTNSRKEYQLGAILEGDEIVINNTINSVKASTKYTATAMIKGNYNGQVIKMNAYNRTYVLAVPCIITSTGGTLLDIIQNKSLVYNGYKNLPFNYNGTNFNINGEGDLNLINSTYLELFSGSLDDFENESIQLDLLSNLQNAYSNTDIINNQEINEILSYDISNNEEGSKFIIQTIINRSINKNINVTAENTLTQIASEDWFTDLNISIDFYNGPQINENKMYFVADNGSTGNELRITNGTKEGTYLVKDINPGSSSSNIALYYNYFLNGKLYFTADNGTNGKELWVSDGTESGTQLIKDIYPGSTSSQPKSIIFFNSKVVFTANNGTNGKELWISDGTESGTQMIMDIATGSSTSSPSNMIVYNNKIYFYAYNSTNGAELWVTDGTELGTYEVKDINVGPSASNISYIFEFNNKLYFKAYNGVRGLWTSDGTTSGTTFVKEIGFQSSSFIEYDNKIFFRGQNGDNGIELWISDGTTLGTNIFKDIYIGTDSGSPYNFNIYDNKIFFYANDGINGVELWSTNGTEIGTNIVKDINSGLNGSYPSNFFIANNKMFFSADDGINGDELWVTDGTESGTIMLNDFIPGSDYSIFYNSNMISFNNKFYFTVINEENDDEENGKHEGWLTDGTQGGTIMIKNYDSNITEYVNTNYSVFQNKLYFFTFDGVDQFKLWVTDGTGNSSIYTGISSTMSPGG